MDSEQRRAMERALLLAGACCPVTDPEWFPVLDAFRAALATPDAAPRSADASPDYATEARAIYRQFINPACKDHKDIDGNSMIETITHLAQRVARESVSGLLEPMAPEFWDTLPEAMERAGLRGGASHLRRLVTKIRDAIRTAHGEASPSIPECGTCGGSGWVKHCGECAKTEPCPECQGGE